jgi:hypothetical protein
MILKRHKNAFYHVVQQLGLDVGDFQWSEDTVSGTGSGASSFTLQYKASPLRFTIVESRSNHDFFTFNYTEFQRGFPEIINVTEKALDFAKITENLKWWIDRHLRQYIEEESLPDLWAQLSVGSEVFGDFLARPLDETAFTVFEKQNIRLALDRFRLSIEETFQPSEEDRATIAERLDYLAQAVDRLNKTDWHGIGISTVIGIATTLGLDSEKGRLLYGLLQQAFTTVWHLLSQ